MYILLAINNLHFTVRTGYISHRHYHCAPCSINTSTYQSDPTINTSICSICTRPTKHAFSMHTHLNCILDSVKQ